LQLSACEVDQSSRAVLQGVSTVLEIEPPVIVVGDLHGNIFDLLRILLLTSGPPAHQYVFLGDYVDRGEYSIEVVTLLFALLLEHPEHIFLIRGNHEFASINAAYGFRAELDAAYPEDADALFDAFNNAFNYLPIAALIGRDILCVHGGISPNVASMAQLQALPRPCATYDDKALADILWSDPSYETRDYERNERGNGVLFGVGAVVRFLSQLKIRHIIRAHECVKKGVDVFADGAVYTVFSCSNYRDAGGNWLGLIRVTDQARIRTESHPPVTQIPRKNVLVEACPDRVEPPHSPSPMNLMSISARSARNRRFSATTLALGQLRSGPRIVLKPLMAPASPLSSQPLEPRRASLPTRPGESPPVMEVIEEL
jgi:protein phosphatase